MKGRKTRRWRLRGPLEPSSSLSCPSDHDHDDMAAKRKTWLGEFWRPLAALLLWVLGMVPLIAAPPLLPSLAETRIGGLTAFPVDCIPAAPLFSSDLTRACGPPLYDSTSGCSVAAKSGMQGPSPIISAGKQGKHIPGHNNFTPGRSELTSDASVLGRNAGTGQPIGTTPIGQAGSKERVNFGETIGNYVDPATGMSTPTNNGIIHYANDGIHIVPARP